MSARLRQEQAASKLDVFQFLPAAIVINRRLLFCMTTSTWALSKNCNANCRSDTSQVHAVANLHGRWVEEYGDVSVILT